VTVPLYAYDHTYEGSIPERQALKLERDGLARLVRHPKGRIARVIMRRRPGDADLTRLRDYQGKDYSFEQHLEDGHRPWALKPLTGRLNRYDRNMEYHLAPADLRPIFIRVLLDCLVRQG
jgi:hypothetical protein